MAGSAHRPTHSLLLPLAHPAHHAPSPALLARLRTLCPLQADPFEDIVPDRSLAHWTRSIHLFPAAYPRSLRRSAVHHLPPPRNRTRGSGRAVAESLQAENLAAETVRDPHATDQPQLFVSVARYSQSREPGQAAGTKDEQGQGQRPVTLVLAHACGFHKEIWEPTLAHLLVSPAGQAIDEIWSIDAVNHGDSALLNRQHLGTVFDWKDNARDLLQFILCYLPDQRLSRDSVPTVLPRLECPPAALLLDEAPPLTLASGRWRNRRVGAIGHSLGGCAAALAATSIPELFDRVLFVDPVIEPRSEDQAERIMALASSSAMRRDSWPNLAEATAKFQANPSFFGRWDASVLARYVRFALQGDPPKLKCDPLHEASIFTAPHGRAADAYDRLLEVGPPELDWRIILAAENQSVISEPVIQKHLAALVSCGRVSRVQSSGHLIVQEQPAALASHIARLLILPQSAKL